MTYLGFYDVRGFAPMPVEPALPVAVVSAIIDVARWVLSTLRDERDFETCAGFMAADGEWLMWFKHRRLELELKAHPNCYDIILRVISNEI